jgi:ATP-dependent Clp protease ATP-binding subunit ClpA
VLAVSEWLHAGVCKFRECCHSNDGTGYILFEKGCDNLLDDLKTKVYGQPLIVKPIYKSLKAHMTNDKPARPLVMYFSGWTGTGKTYVARLIAQNLFKEGMKSKFVKYISSSYHFPMKIEGDEEVARERERLRTMIRDTVRNCDRSLIIMDELDKLPAGVVDALQPMLDYIEDIDGQRYNKAIFIFLSNTGAQRLNKLAYNMFQEGKERKDLSSKDIEELMIEESFDEQGGLRHSTLLKRYSIGVFVPFLPLERLHVKLCIQTEIENSHVIPDSLENLVEEIADEVAYFPPETEMYSKSGCKGIHEKVINHIGPPIQLNIKSMNRSEDKLVGTRHDL